MKAKAERGPIQERAPSGQEPRGLEADTGKLSPLLLASITC